MITRNLNKEFEIQYGGKTMAYIYPIPVILIGGILYIATKQWDLKIFAFISKVLVIAALIFFVITYASYLGYNIPFISNFFNNLVG